MTITLVRVIFSLAVGWLLSGIINYIADVLPQNRKLVVPTCNACGAHFPMKRYILYTHCIDCSKPLSKRHYIVLISILAIVFYLAFAQSDLFVLSQDVLITAYIALIIVIDIEHHLILHITSILGAILSATAGILRHGIQSTLIGAVAGIGVMFVLFLIGIYFGRYLSKSRGEEVEEGLGFGDVILGGICGLLLGWPGVTIGLFTGIVLGGLYSLGLVVIHLIKKKYQPFMAIPYGPFLAGAAYFFWIFR